MEHLCGPGGELRQGTGLRRHPLLEHQRVCRGDPVHPGRRLRNHATPEIADLLSGLALFPLQGGTGIALTTYSNHYIWFYEWNNTSLEYIGKAQCPAPCQPSAGLAYSHSRGTLFWSYKVPSGDYMVSELSFEIGMALGQTTWGGIKTSF